MCTLLSFQPVSTGGYPTEGSVTLPNSYGQNNVITPIAEDTSEEQRRNKRIQT